MTDGRVDETFTISSGIAGLDGVLHGGFHQHGVHLVTGPAGGGKTTFGLHFLLQGAREGETVLYLTLSQSERDLRQTAKSHGMSLEGVHIRELRSHDLHDLDAAEQTVFHTSEVELRETMSDFVDAIDRIAPRRIVFDSIAELRLLAGEELGYRRRILALRQHLTQSECTTLLLQPVHEGEHPEPMRDLVRGVIELQQSTPEYGEIRRTLKITKMRGATFDGGNHSFAIRTGGIRVFPRLKIQTRRQEGQEPESTVGPALMPSGIQSFDELLGGGLMAGTSCLLVGPAGAGKSSLTAAYLHAAAERGERVGLFLFEELPGTYLKRSRELGMDLGQHVREGRASIRLIDTGEISPGEFAQDVMATVDAGATVVGIDSLTAYYHAMQNERLLVSQMHELLINLSQRGVLTLLTVAQHGVVGTGLHGPDVSYLADNLILLRHFEAAGTLRKALSVVKRRYGQNEPSIREIHFSSEGIRVGEPLAEFQGILTGSPQYHGDRSLLIDEGGGGADGSGKRSTQEG